MGKREFLQLAHVYDAGKHEVTNWFLSEKLDGHRFFWDGGVSRGVAAREVPWANTEKDARLLAQPIATGLWSRYGHVIHAPEWWLRSLPAMPLDGELWAGRGRMQFVTSVVKKLNPTPEWSEIKAMVFNTPPMDVVLGVGEISNTNYKKRFTNEPVDWCKRRGVKDMGRRFTFAEAYAYLSTNLPENDVVSLVKQTEIKPPVAKFLESKLEEVVGAGGEGLMLQHPRAYWIPERSKMLLKVKPFQDAEGIVTGYTWGRATEKGSKLLGLMGALVVDFNGKRLELSGFTDAERELVPKLGIPADEGLKNPGKPVSSGWRSYEFPIGSKVTFRYRELTDDGIPKEARFWRVRDDF